MLSRKVYEGSFNKLSFAMFLVIIYDKFFEVWIVSLLIFLVSIGEVFVWNIVDLF